MKVLPEKTVERLSEYRRALIKCLDSGQTHIYSHQLAKLLNLTAVQVRRDLMFIGYSSLQRKGYDIKALVDLIVSILDAKEGLNIAVVGMGNLGTAITSYFTGKRSRLNIVAVFDIDQKTIGKAFNGIACYNISELKKMVQEKNIKIAILTVPPNVATQTANDLKEAGIAGILNFTTVPLHIGEQIYVEDYDMVTSIEKVAYFVKNK
ncbi:MAG: redox-sensing transcriptional repressor Rex [Bacteroidetes bacterium]|jgi:redox-sensing transcriptional repressor|nr:redox-sensing transcriptional repressor Rex [Bacteroidota bacterium]